MFAKQIFFSTQRRPSRYFINLLDSTQPGGEVEDLRPLVLSEKAISEDNPRYHEAMNGPDAEDFRDAMQIEYDQLQKRRLGYLLKKRI